MNQNVDLEAQRMFQIAEYFQLREHCTTIAESLGPAAWLMNHRKLQKFILKIDRLNARTKSSPRWA